MRPQYYAKREVMLRDQSIEQNHFDFRKCKQNKYATNDIAATVVLTRCFKLYTGVITATDRMLKTFFYLFSAFASEMEQ